MNVDSFISNGSVDAALLDARASATRDHWRQRTLWLVLALTLFRVIYQIGFCPYELVADEAHYWEWSRRPALSYYSKGPGVAWTNIVTTHLLGDQSWALRLPSVLASAMTMMLLAALTRKITGSSRAGFLAAALVALCPGFQAVPIIMTTDGPYVACWALATWAGWWALGSTQNEQHQKNLSWAASLTLAVALGVGFLFKFTIMLLPVGLLGFAIFSARKNSTKTMSCSISNSVKILASALLTLLIISPVILWNHQHDWPSLRHLLGFLKIKGGDYAPAPMKLGLYWPVHFFVTQLGVAGPTIVALMLFSVFTKRATNISTQARAYLLWCAAPILLFYFFVSFAREIEGNWPIAGYLTLLVLVADRLSIELAHYQQCVAQWCENPARPRLGFFRRKPETLFQILWHWTLGIGVVVGLGMLWINVASQIPLIGKFIPRYRTTGFRQQAADIQSLIERVEQEQHQTPLVIVTHYGNASQLAYYLPGHPLVFSATNYMGGRKSSYDFFSDTDLKAAYLQGKPAILIGTQQAHWQRVLAFDQIHGTEKLSRGVPVYIGLGYRGPTELGLQQSTQR